MVLNVDPAELISSAAQLAGTALGTHAALPGGWVVPAAADHVSAWKVPVLNGRAAEFFNQTSRVLHGIHGTAGDIGAAAAAYSAADAQGGTAVDGSGGEVLTNPVVPVEEFGQRVPPEYTFPDAGSAVDPLTFAQHLHAGPGPGPASGFADDVRQYLGGAHNDAATTVSGAMQAMRNWTPVGDAAAATLSGHASDLNVLGGALQELIDSIDTYSTAFQTAKAIHPTPQEIIDARRRLIAAMRSKDEPGILLELAILEEQNALSASTISDYATTVGLKTLTDTTTTPPKTTTTGASGPSSAASDSSTMAAILPALASLMSAGAQGASDLTQNLGPDQSPNLSDSTDALSSLDGGSIPDLSGLDVAPGALSAPAASIGDAASAIDNFAMGAMPMVAAAASLDASSLPAAAASQSFSAASADAQAAAGRAGSSGMPYMPMMPGGAGAGGGAGGGERNRVVAWHPDRLMYVDDTPHTEQVIGEKPTIAPVATPPTPVNQIPS